MISRFSASTHPLTPAELSIYNGSTTPVYPESEGFGDHVCGTKETTNHRNEEVTPAEPTPSPHLSPITSIWSRCKATVTTACATAFLYGYAGTDLYNRISSGTSTPMMTVCTVGTIALLLYSAYRNYTTAIEGSQRPSGTPASGTTPANRL